MADATQPQKPPPRRHKIKADQPQQPAEPKNTAPAIPVEVVIEGKDRPFLPVSPLDAMMGPNPLVHGVMLRQLADMSGLAPEQVPNSALETLNKLQQGFSCGTDISALSPSVGVHINGQSEKAELAVGLLNAHDQERLIRFVNGRHTMEIFILSCLNRQDLTTMEALALSSYIKGEIDDITSRIRKEVRQEPSKDTDDIIQRANINSQRTQKGLQQKFNSASPQEREILRKLGFKAKKILAARITKTTTTTTTEVVQKQ